MGNVLMDGKDYDTSEAKSWSGKEAERIEKYLFQRGGEQEGTAEYDMLREVREARKEDPDAVPGEVDLSKASADEVLTWVGDDPQRAQEAYDAEQERDKPRKTVTDALEGGFDVQ